MDILGISFNFHDASACLLRDGAVIAAAEEERFSRLKHDRRFPLHAIEYCLTQGHIRAEHLAAVSFYEKPARKIERMLRIAASQPEIASENLRRQLSDHLTDGLRLEALLRDKVRYEGPVFYSPHHLSHAASAFYLSPFPQAAVMTVDGVGEWTTTAQFAGEDCRLVPLREIHYPHSLGLFYSTLTSYLGFNVNEDEFRVMGLASYGVPRYREQIDRLLQLRDDGSFRLAPEFFAFAYSSHEMYAPSLIELLGPARLPDEPIAERHQDIAASLQSALEDAMVNLVTSLKRLHASENLCMAGGVAYNCVANSKIAEHGGFRRVWIQPAAGDNGAALGAALVAHFARNGSAPARAPIHHDTRLGPSFADGVIREALNKAGLKYQQLREPELCRDVAQLISRGLIVGWFQGRMEFGPRALGSRSILANPCDPEMKDILNRRVKFREEFRPFAPAVIEEAADAYFEMMDPSPFMLFAPRVRPEMAARIPSVTHVDGTARVQTVSAGAAPLFHRLICEFGKISGVPIIINTSFNISGEPIVCTPSDAVRCFINTDIDALAIGNCLVCK